MRAAGALLAVSLAVAPACAEDAALRFYAASVLQELPHDTDAFTQGLVVENGVLIETTGHYGRSTIRRVDLESGEVLSRQALPPEVFGEGSTILNGKIFAVTWRSGRGFIFDPETLERTGAFTYEGEGWGLTHDGEALILSDGTPQLRFLDPETFEQERAVTVTFKGKPLSYLNELEWVEGEIFANVWQTDAIVRIDPESGVVTGVIDLRGLLPAANITPGETDVLNGIAYDDETGRLFVTGKNWPKLFEIELRPVNQ